MIDRCPACGHVLESVRVSSHEQCRRCGWVCETCCEGADLDGCSEVAGSIAAREQREQ